MDFTLGEMELALRESLDRFLTDRHDFQERQRRTIAEPWPRDLWLALAELGVLGAAIPEAHGGLGGGAAETSAVMECLGRHLVGVPYLSTVVMGAGFLRDAAGADVTETLAAIAAGATIIAIAHDEARAGHDLTHIATCARKTAAGYVLDGRKTIVLDAPLADKIIVTARTAGASGDADGISVFLVDAAAAGIRQMAYRTIDGGRAADITFDQVSAIALIGEEGEGLELIERVMDEATAAICAEACGVLQAMLDQTLAYTRQRIQFGRPLAQNQVLQHRMVDMMIDIKQAVGLAMVAHLKLGTPDRAAAVSAAKSRIGRACRFVGQNAVQLHGGMGITDELVISHYFKRALMIDAQFGSGEYHHARYERKQIAPASL